jgi:copper homeostasis protein
MLEVCVDTVQAASIAVLAGAQRIELCERLSVGGVTPSASLISEVRKAVKVPLIVLIRSRAGNFEFSDDEVEQMIYESQHAIRLGADGVAIGGLLPGGSLDTRFLNLIASSQPKCELVMHRAFDGVRDPIQSIEDLIAIGFRRILTSGGPLRAIDGVNNLKKWNECACNRVELLPAGGVLASNALEILTGSQCRQLHGSFRMPNDGNQNNMLPDSIGVRTTRQILDDYLAVRARA